MSIRGLWDRAISRPFALAAEGAYKPQIALIVC